MLIDITEAAKIYFKEIIDSQAKEIKVNKLNLKIKVTDPGSSTVGIELSYCLAGEQHPSDIPINLKDFILYVEQNSEQALLDAIIDYRSDNQASNDGKLHIKAPFLYKKFDNSTDNQNSLLFNEINQFIMQEINPWLARHKGKVKLSEVNELNEGVSISLEFGGGCKGCSMINFTLKKGIEKTLKNKFTQIVLIKDITDHVTGKNPYYT